MDANYVVEFEQYYEVLRPIKRWYAPKFKGAKMTYDTIAAGSIIKGKDLWGGFVHTKNTYRAKRIISIYCDVGDRPLLRPLPHQVFF